MNTVVGFNKLLHYKQSLKGLLHTISIWNSLFPVVYAIILLHVNKSYIGTIFTVLFSIMHSSSTLASPVILFDPTQTFGLSGHEE